MTTGTAREAVLATAPGAFAAPTASFDINRKWKNGVLTSGRRTPEGNAAVGGVSNSWHLNGDAFDVAGPDLNALLGEVRQAHPQAKAFIHNGNHVHAQQRGLGVPYFGKRGARGKR